MSNNQFPKSLFRYISLNDDNERFVRRLLCENYIYFSKPSQFNDPFDCKAHWSIGETEEEKIKFFTFILKQCGTSLDHVDEEEVKSNLIKMNWQKDPTKHQQVKDIIDPLVENTGVLCFTEKPDNLLMWAHYAQNHTGLCIQFDFDEHGLLDEKCDKVIYSKNYPLVNLAKEPEENWAKIFLLTKSKDWEYEHEWRFIDLRGSGEKVVPHNFVRGIIFGLRMLDKNKNKIISWFKNRDYIPKFYQAQKHEKRYSIKIIPSV